MDFGCGSKPWEHLFSRASSYIGVDISDWQDQSLDESKKKADVYFDGVSLPFSDGYFDAVVAFEVFEHLPDPRASLKEIRRILKSGGVILISTPFIYGEHGAPYDYVRFTSSGMQQLLEECKFIQTKQVKSASFLATLLQTWVLYVENQSKSVPSVIGMIMRVCSRFIAFVIHWPTFRFSKSLGGESYYLNLITLAKKSD